MSNPLNGTRGTLWGVGPNSRRLGQLVFVATVNVEDPVGLTDVAATHLSLDATGRLRVQLGNATVSVQPSAGALADMPGAAARVVAPGAGAIIATIAAGSLPAGTYDIQVAVGFDEGAPVAADINNMEFREGATVVSSLQVFAVINPARFLVTFRRALDGATAVSVNATAAGTAGVGYNAQLVVIRVA